jgi:hypothetical protein
MWHTLGKILGTTLPVPPSTVLGIQDLVAASATRPRPPPPSLQLCGMLVGGCNS